MPYSVVYLAFFVIFDSVLEYRHCVITDTGVCTYVSSLETRVIELKL